MNTHYKLYWSKAYVAQREFLKELAKRANIWFNQGGRGGVEIRL